MKMNHVELFKPMLAAKPKGDNLALAIDEVMRNLRYPVMASPKVDGMRAEVQNQDLYSRALKLIPNVAMREAWSTLHDNLDGEIVCGNPTAEDAFNRAQSQVLSADGGIADARYFVFDCYHPTAPFILRYQEAEMWVKRAKRDNVLLLPHKMIPNYKTLRLYDENTRKLGFEGVCVRDPQGVYKQNRSTIAEGGLIAFKPYADAEAKIIAIYEQEENTNEATINELGRTKRSSHQAGKVGKDTLGGFTVKCKLFKEPFNVGTGIGLTNALRDAIWAKRKSYVGKTIKFKYQAVGTLVKPRQPIFLGFRDARDMS